MVPHRIFIFLLYFIVVSLTWAPFSSKEANDFQDRKIDSAKGTGPLGFYVHSELIESSEKTGLIEEKNPSICKSCCKMIEIRASEGALDNWPDTIGQYRILGSHNGKNNFLHQENANKLYWNDDNFWAVGESYYEAKLFSMATDNCPQDTLPWYYFSTEGTRLEDSSVNVVCVENTDCCEDVKITSTGGSAELWEDTLGSYSIADEQHNGKHQYKNKQNLNKIYWNDDNFWAVSDSYSEAKLYTPANGNCPDGPSLWLYFASEDGWLEDATMNIGCGGFQECCQVVEIYRSSEHWEDTVGQYIRMSNQHNGKTQFQHNDGNFLYWNNNDDFGPFWAVGDDYEYAKLYSLDDTRCPKDTSSWMYFGDDGLWYEDNTMEIYCKDSTTIGPDKSTTTVPKVSTTQQGDCCHAVEINRSSEHWEDTAGDYTRMPDQHNGKAQFQHNNSNLLYWNNNNGFGPYWAVGKDYFNAELYTLDDTMCPTGTLSWMYFGDDGLWYEDNTMEIYCKDSTTIGPDKSTTTVPEVSTTQQGSCCHAVEVSHSSEHWVDTVGDYIRMSDQHNGKDQFQHNNGNLLYWHTNNVFGPYWAVGKDYEYAKLYTLDDTMCPTGTSSWMYFGDDGLWYEDNTMEIHCKDGTTSGPNKSTTTAPKISTTQQVDCPVDWYDATSVGMGCLYVDVDTAGHHSVTDAQAACEKILSGSHLVEIFDDQQMTYLKDLLAEIEIGLGNENGLFWWLPLQTEDVESGVWTWPFSGQQAEYTYWADGEPFPQEDYNCAQILSARFKEGKWWAARCFDDYPNELHVCQTM